MQTNNQHKSEDEIDLLEILFVLLSYRWLIFASIIIFAIIGSLYNYYHQDIFKTNATLLISDDQSDPSSFINNNEYEFLYNNNLEGEDQVSVFKSTLILNEVVEKLGLNYRYFKQNRWKNNEVLTKESLPFEFVFKKTNSNNSCTVSFNNKNVIITTNDQIFSFSTNESEFENSIFIFKPKLTNYLDHNTYVINQFTKSEAVVGLKSNYTVSKSKSKTYEISYSGTNKRLNTVVLNGIINGIIDNNVKEKKSVYELSISFIDNRIYKLKEKIDSLNSAMSDFKISNGVYIPENQTNSALNNLNEIEQKIFANLLQSELSVKLLNDVKKQNSFDLLPTDIGIENKNINEMVFQFNKIILEKNNLLVDATEKNPLVIQSQNQLIDLKSNILYSLNIYINKLKMKLNRYDEYKQESNSLVGVIPIREAELSNLERDLLIVNNLHSYLSQKKEEAMINISSLESNIKLINEVDYVVVSESNKTKKLAIFIFSGFFLPIGFSVSMFFWRTFYIDVEYLKENLNGINFLGIIKFTKNKLSNENRIIKDELLNRIYHNMNLIFTKSIQGKSIMITSCIKNEGKTHTAYNLSTFLASRNKKVILIGSDVRNPDLSKLFNHKGNSKGLTDIINDSNNDFKELFEKYKINQNQLDTLFVGTQINNNVNIFNSKKFDILISFLKKKYDYIIFDTAPVLFMVDSLDLLKKSDFVFHVFRKNFSPKKLVSYVLDYKEKYKIKNMSYIITDDSKPDKFLDKYGYKYGYGYGYGYGYK
jgi:uncharacterized protein involved in exopolysaccharide biosynthesis/Mrp family chromosome partitioning ATPase